MHKACTDCIAARKARFGEDWDKLKCSFIKEDALEGYNTDGMSEDEKTTLRDLFDPYRWGVKEFNLNPRDYQNVMANCTATRQVYRLGRRTGKTVSLLLRALHRMFLNPGKKVLLFTPYENQIKVFFSMIEAWRSESVTLHEAIEAGRIVKDPFTLELGNGSSLIGFTTGTKSGMKSASARGQEADIIILDEADYLTRDDLTAILPMLQKTNETSTEAKELWAASTPTGRHDFFYDWAHSAGFKEFHHPSWVNPAWDQEAERESHELFPNKTDWEHEYAAEWGEETEGVYPHTFIDRALDLSRDFIGNNGRWDYSKQAPKAGCIYTVGVDWNSSSNGVQIVMMEYDPAYVTPEDIAQGIRGRFRIATRENIDAKEYTQTKAVKKIIELNYLWKPKAIYVDEGYGMTQIEDLKRYGHDHPESQILARLEPINFSSMQEVRDPVTKQLVKKHMKPFIVFNSLNYLEKNLILLNRADTEFEKQLRDYTVEKRSREGRPVFSEGNDHVLDAFNLAMTAYTMKFTDLGRPLYTTAMQQVGPMGEKKTSLDADRNGDMKIVDKTKNKVMVRPRQIPMNDTDGRRVNRAWKNSSYSSAKMNRPIKRSI